MSTAFIVSTTDVADELKTAIVVEGGDFWEVHSTDFEGEVTTVDQARAVVRPRLLRALRSTRRVMEAPNLCRRAPSPP